MATLRYFLSEALTSMNRSRGISFLAVATIAVALSMLGAFLYLSWNFTAVVERWSDEVQLSIYLSDDLATGDLGTLRSLLDGQEGVEEVEYVSKEQALQRFATYFADLSDLPELLGENPLPASFEVRLGETARTPEQVARLAAAVQGFEGVEEVQYDTGWVERLDTLVRLATAAGYVLGGVLLLAAVFTTSNVIRLALFSRRDEVDILRLVGATPWFIQGPFLVEGALQGLLGGLAAVLLLATVHLGLHTAWTDGMNLFLRIATAEFLPAETWAALVAAGGFMGLAGSFLAVRRFLAVGAPGWGGR